MAVAECREKMPKQVWRIYETLEEIVTIHLKSNDIKDKFSEDDEERALKK